MKSELLSRTGTQSSVRASLKPGLFLLALAISAFYSLSSAAPNPKPAAPTNEMVISPSVFVLPTSPQEGKDPFYPRSMRPYAAYRVAHTNPVVVAAPILVDLHLNGISGTVTRPLAIINNRTFSIGEQAEVPTSTGRVTVRCLEIRNDTVIIQSQGENRVLHLRSGL